MDILESLRFDLRVLPGKFPVTVESVKIAATTDTDTEGELSQDTRELSVKSKKKRLSTTRGFNSSGMGATSSQENNNFVTPNNSPFKSHLIAGSTPIPTSCQVITRNPSIQVSGASSAPRLVQLPPRPLPTPERPRILLPRPSPFDSLSLNNFSSDFGIRTNVISPNPAFGIKPARE